MLTIRRNELPASTRGRGANTSPSVGITASGQLRFNKALVDALGPDRNLIDVGIDEKNRNFILTVFRAVPKGVKAEALFELKTDKSGAYAAMTGVWKHEGVDYDFKGSGNQTFPATVDAKAGTVSIHLPHNVTPRPTTPRKPKAEKTQAASAGTSNTGNGNSSIATLKDLD